MPHFPRSLASVLLAVGLLAAACSSGGPSSSPSSSSTTSTAAAGGPTTVGPPSGPSSVPAPAAGTAAAAAITIRSFAFEPDELSARVGDTITVTNADGTNHTVTAVDGSFDTGRFDSGTRTFTLDRPGRFEFRCDVHSFMSHGFIQVAG
jgi:plastocyanin